MDLALCISLTPKDTSHLGDEDLAELDSPEFCDAVVRALERLGTVRVWDTTMLSPKEIAAERRPDLIFNLSEGIYGTGREAQAPALFEWLQWPYVGSDPVTLGITHDKWYTKCILDRAGIPTPQAALIHRADGRVPELSFPVIAKPVAEGAGKGIYDTNVVDDGAALAEIVGTFLDRYRQPLLVEEFLPGREFTAAVIGNRGSFEVLPLVEIDFTAIPRSPRRVYGYEAKFLWHSGKHMVCPPKIDASLQREMESLAVATCEALGIRDWARVDLRLNAKGRPHVLEVNPLPGIYPELDYISCFTTSAYAAGMTFERLVERLVRTAMDRYRSDWFLPHKVGRGQQSG